MTEFPQETDSDLVSPPETCKATPMETTTGAEDTLAAASLSSEGPNPTQAAKEVISRIKNETVRKQAQKIISAIDNTLHMIHQERPDITRIPILYTHPIEDEAVLIEWIFRDFRIGFNVEPDPKDTGWHIVSGENLDDFAMSQRLTDYKKTVQAILSMILSNT